jgi:hypothetical protein
MQKSDKQQENPAPVMEVADKLSEQNLCFKKNHRIVSFGRHREYNKTAVKHL